MKQTMMFRLQVQEPPQKQASLFDLQPIDRCAHESTFENLSFDGSTDTVCANCGSTIERRNQR